MSELSPIEEAKEALEAAFRALNVEVNKYPVSSPACASISRLQQEISYVAGTLADVAKSLNDVD